MSAPIVIRRANEERLYQIGQRKTGHKMRAQNASVAHVGDEDLDIIQLGSFATDYKDEWILYLGFTSHLSHDFFYSLEELEGGVVFINIVGQYERCITRYIFLEGLSMQYKTQYIFDISSDVLLSYMKISHLIRTRYLIFRILMK